MTNSEFFAKGNAHKGFLLRLGSGDILNYEAEMAYDKTDRIVFGPSKSLIGTGLPELWVPLSLLPAAANLGVNLDKDTVCEVSAMDVETTRFA